MFSVSSRCDFIDIIRDYEESRYLLSSEAAWHIMKFEILSKSLSVIRCKVHVPNHKLHQMKHNIVNESGCTKRLWYHA